MEPSQVVFRLKFITSDQPNFIELFDGFERTFLYYTKRYNFYDENFFKLLSAIIIDNTSRLILSLNARNRYSEILYGMVRILAIQCSWCDVSIMELIVKHCLTPLMGLLPGISLINSVYGGTRNMYVEILRFISTFDVGKQAMLEKWYNDIFKGMCNTENDQHSIFATIAISLNSDHVPCQKCIKDDLIGYVYFIVSNLQNPDAARLERELVVVEQITRNREFQQNAPLVLITNICEKLSKYGHSDNISGAMVRSLACLLTEDRMMNRTKELYNKTPFRNYMASVIGHVLHKSGDKRLEIMAQSKLFESNKKWEDV